MSHPGSKDCPAPSGSEPHAEAVKPVPGGMGAAASLVERAWRVRRGRDDLLVLTRAEVAEDEACLAAQRAAINAPMQGTAADMIKLAMLDIDEWIETDAQDVKMTMQVHDELVFEVPEAKVELVKVEAARRMEDAFKLDVPLIVDIGVGNN